MKVSEIADLLFTFGTLLALAVAVPVEDPKQCASYELFYDHGTENCEPCRDICRHADITGTKDQCSEYCPSEYAISFLTASSCFTVLSRSHSVSLTHTHAHKHIPQTDRHTQHTLTHTHAHKQIHTHAHKHTQTQYLSLIHI